MAFTQKKIIMVEDEQDAAEMFAGAPVCLTKSVGYIDLEQAIGKALAA